MKKLILLITLLCIISILNINCTNDITLNNIESISITNLPKKVNYYLFEEIDLSGIEIQTNTGEIVTNKVLTNIDKIDNQISGQKEVIISYNGFNTSFYINYYERIIKDIKITKTPNKTIYLCGESLDLTGMIVTCEYNNQNEILNDYQIKDYDNQTAGTKTIIVEYLTFQDSFIVEYKDYVTSIKIINEPNKKVFYNDEDIKYDGLKVAKCYYTGKEEEITDYNLICNKETGYVKVVYNDFVAEFNISIIDDVPVRIQISDYPTKLEYILGEQISYDGLQIELVYLSGKTKNIKDYEITSPDMIIGHNQVDISYMDLTTSFDIIYNDAEKIDIDKITDYDNISSKALNSKYLFITIFNVKNGGTRGKDEYVLYDESNLITRNKYGYEVAINEYGIITNKGINVELPENGYVLSGHGVAGDNISLLDIGDIVLYESNYKSLTVYRNYVVSKFIPLITEMEKNISLINQNEYDNNIDYNFDVNKLNQIIPLFNYCINNKDYNAVQKIIDDLNNLDILVLKKDNKYSNDYTLLNKDLLTKNKFNFLIDEFEFEEYDVITNIVFGGFRYSDTFVYYCKDNYRKRNSFGYEVAVDKNGTVIQKDFLVDLPEDGFILSGVESTGQYLIDNIEYGNKLIYDKENKTITVLKNNYYSSLLQVYKKIKSLEEKIINQNDKIIPLNYAFIKELFNALSNKYNEMTIILENELTLYSKNVFQNNLKSIDTLIRNITFLLIEETSIFENCMWYYPFTNNSSQNDFSIDGICETLDLLQRININTIYIDCNCQGGYSIFNSSLYNIYPNIDNSQYGEYDDYLSCFIGEAHKRNIYVAAFTATFMYQTKGLNITDDSWYQMDFQGNKSKGSVYYYDICNDNIQEALLGWYDEISSYDFDIVEYDIIRYPSSNLSTFSDEEVITKPTTITDMGYTTYTINKFMDLYHLTGDIHDLIINSSDIRKKWLEFKEEQLVSFITKASQIIRENNPNVRITAAVSSDYELAKTRFLQNYLKWYDLGIIDGVETMIYTSSNTELENSINSCINLIPIKNVRIGLSSKLSSNDISIDYEQIELVKSYNFSGYVFYSSKQYLYNLDFISTYNLSSYQSVSPLSSYDTKIKAICGILLKKIAYYEQIIDYDFTVLKEKINDKDYDEMIKQIELVSNQLIKNQLLNEIDNISN